MKLKNLLMSTVVFFGLSLSYSIDSFHKNIIKNSVTSNYSSKSFISEPEPPLPVILDATLSDTFPGIVFHFDTHNVVFYAGDYIKYVEINAKTNVGGTNRILRIDFPSTSTNKIDTLNDNLNFVCGKTNQSIDYLQNWSKELNSNDDNNKFKNLSLTYDNYDWFNVNTSYTYTATVHYNGVNDKKSPETSNTIKLSDSTVENYDRADISEYSCTYISDHNDPNYGWFEGQIVLDNKYTDIINEDSVKFYYMDQETECDLNNFKLNFDSLNNSYKFYLKPFKYDENNFWISFNLSYSVSPQSTSIIPDLLKNKNFQVINPLKYTDPTIDANIEKISRVDGLESFKLLYSITTENLNETIDSIYLADSSDLNKPDDRINEIDDFNKNIESGIKKEIGFSIYAVPNEKIKYDLSLVVNIKDMYGGNHNFIKKLDSFEIEPLNTNVSIDIGPHAINSTRTSSLYNYSIDIGDNFQLTKVTFDPTDPNVNQNNIDHGYINSNELSPYNFVNPTLEGNFNFDNLPSSNILEVQDFDPQFEMIIEYNEAINHNLKTFDAGPITIERAQGYRPAILGGETIDSINVKNNKITINLKINKFDLGDDQLDSIVLEGNNTRYTLESKDLVFSDDKIYLLGSFYLDGLEYKTYYKYKLIYYVIPGDESGKNELDSINVDFTTGPKDYTKQALIWSFIDIILLFITFIMLILLTKRAWKITKLKNKNKKLNKF